jgi:CRP/FNR family transcriptional regulator
MNSPSTPLITELDAIAVPVVLAMGEILFQTGDPGEGVYLLRTGKISFTRTDDQRHYSMETLGPGSMIGLPAVLNGSYSLTAQALETSALGFVSESQVITLLARYPRLRLEAMKALAKELASLRTMIAENADHEHRAMPV